MPIKQKMWGKGTSDQQLSSQERKTRQALDHKPFFACYSGECFKSGFRCPSFNPNKFPVLITQFFENLISRVCVCLFVLVVVVREEIITKISLDNQYLKQYLGNTISSSGKIDFETENRHSKASQ